MSKEENKFSEEDISEALKSVSKEAEVMLQDEDKVEHSLQRLEKKLQKIPAIGNQLADITTLISLIRSYIRKEYREIPFGSIVSIFGGLLYFLSPVDLVPDVIPVFGYLDDIAVIKLVMTMVNDDVEEYKIWREKNGKNV